MNKQMAVCQSLIVNIFQEKIEQSLANILLSIEKFRVKLCNSNTYTEFFFKYVAGVKVYLDNNKFQYGFLNEDFVDLSLKNYLLQVFSDNSCEQYIEQLIKNKNVNTNEAGRLALIKFSIYYIINHYNINGFTLVDIGSSAGLHLLWENLSVYYKKTCLGNVCKKHTIKSNESSTFICNLVGNGVGIPCLSKKIEPKNIITIDDQIISIDEQKDLTWLFALTPKNDFCRQSRLRWALNERKNCDFDFFRADATSQLNTIVQDLNTRNPLVLSHTFLHTNWTEFQKSNFYIQLKKISRDKLFYEVGVEFDKNYQCFLTISLWRNCVPINLLTKQCDPQGRWIKI